MRYSHHKLNFPVLIHSQTVYSSNLLPLLQNDNNRKILHASTDSKTLIEQISAELGAIPATAEKATSARTSGVKRRFDLPNG